MSSKESSGSLGGTLERVPLAFLRVTLTWFTGQSNDGKESRNASFSHCASITLAYPYTHTPGLSPCLWVSLVGVRGSWGMLGKSFYKIMSSLKLKNRKHKQLKKTQPKYLIAIPTNGQKTFASLNSFKLAQLLDSAAGSKLANVTRLSSGYFLLETSSSKQLAQLQKMELLGDIPVHISPHKSMNFTKGVIKTSDLKDMSREEIIANMHSQDVIDCKRIFFVCDSKTIDTNTYILTFNRLQLSSTVDLGYLHVRVEQYIPRPLRCTKCQKFGHHHCVVQSLSATDAVFLIHKKPHVLWTLP